jgi:hypothetical protein
MFGFAFWNHITSGVPLPWRAKTSSAEAYLHVREERRTPPRLPSVKELTDELRQL